MKKIALSLVLVSGLALAACSKPIGQDEMKPKKPKDIECPDQEDGADECPDREVQP